jgi:diguanylate cyclase (GGDEF)-like protein
MPPQATDEAADDRLTIFVNHKIHDEPESTTLATVRQALIVSLAIGGAITLIVLSISGYTVHRFQTRLERMASIDPLSGLLNRQFAEILFEKALSASRRYGHELSLLLFDIDLFKQINNQLGHATGDQVIASVARIAEENRREIDITCRWGGDEFIVLLADCDEASARRIAETLRQRIQDCVRIPQSAQPVTISIGIAAYRPGESLQDLTARADERLYAAKAEGRNRIA